ncbi:MAG: hypothetical protein AB1505_19015 [Candidatus Latescibacterota bacterium]
MTATPPAAKKRIGNVGTLDLRGATPESFTPIDRIGNVGLVLVTPATAKLVAQLKLGNVGTTLEVPQDAKLVTGRMEITAASLAGQAQPLDLVVAGEVLIAQDVEAAELEKGLGSLAVAGLVLCPEPLMGIVQAKLRQLSGEVQVYDPSMRFAQGEVVADPAYLESLPDGTRLMVLGHVRLPKLVDNALLARKLAELRVIGKITCREENLTTLRSLLDERRLMAHVEVVPAGFEPVDGHILLDTLTLTRLPGRRLLCSGTVQVAEDVGPAALERALEALKVNGLLICPARLRETLAARCDLLHTRAVFYSGELWLIEERTQLRPSRFEYLQGKATLVVQERLTIDPQIDPKVLWERLDRVHNLDRIACTPEQMGAIEARLGLNEGRLVDSTAKAQEGDGEEKEGIGNVGYLKL